MMYSVDSLIGWLQNAAGGYDTTREKHIVYATGKTDRFWLRPGRQQFRVIIEEVRPGDPDWVEPK